MRGSSRRRCALNTAGVLTGATLVLLAGPAALAGAAVDPAPRVRQVDGLPEGPPGTGLHWVLRSGQRSLVVDLVDATGPAWPVRAAARSWRVPGARFAFATSCRAAVPCVVVTETSAGSTGWTGTTTARPGEMFSFTSPVRITLNDSYPLTTSQRQAVACHELGHALGLSHDARSSSCMRPAPAAFRPDRSDLAAVTALYPPAGPPSSPPGGAGG